MKSVICYIFFLSLFFSSGLFAQQPKQELRTYVLVHGAWAGDWSWKPVEKLLRAKGHKVYNVALKGQGSRRNEGSPDITLTDHINDVLSVLEDNNLQNVYLVPHSYGGKVATGAWDRARERIHHTIYIDAFAPVREGNDAFFPSDNVTRFLADNPDATDQSMVPFPAPNAPIAAKTSPMPLGTIGATFGLDNPLPKEALKSYVLAGGFKNSPFQRKYFPIISKDDSWTTYVLPTGHFIMLEMPEVLTAILLNAK